MTRLLIITLFAANIFSSCKSPSDKEKVEKEKVNSVQADNDSTTKLSSQKTEDNFKRVQEFADHVLGDNLRTHSFSNNSEQLENFKLFDKDGLDRIVAFSNKEYPERSEPIYYEHFTLFCFEYSNLTNAENAFHELAKLTKIDFKNSNSLDSATKEMVDRIHGLSKPGGLIVQKGKWIFSLVETCRNTPIGGTWIQYENKFLDFLIDNPDETISVLNADCGNKKYELVKRKKPAHNNT